MQCFQFGTALKPSCLCHLRCSVKRLKKPKSRIMQSWSLKHTHFSVYGYKCVSLWLEPMLVCSQSSDSLLSSSFRQKCAALEWSTRKWNRVWQLVSERRPKNYGCLFRAVLLRVRVCLRVREKNWDRTLSLKWLLIAQRKGFGLRTGGLLVQI